MSQLLIQRSIHLCCLAGYEDFEDSFKARYDALDIHMFDDVYLRFDVDDELDAVVKSKQFVANVCKPHTFRPFVKEEVKEVGAPPKKDSLHS